MFYSNKQQVVEVRQDSTGLLLKWKIQTFKKLQTLVETTITSQ